MPTPTGGTERFAVQRTQLMEAGSPRRIPRSRPGPASRSTTRGTTVALDVTPMGFHASVRGPNGQGAWYVDPAYNKRGTTQHLAYYGSSLPKSSSSPVEREIPQMKRAIDQQRTASQAAPGATVTQRVYRLALISDPTYADYFGTANVLAEKVTLMNRVNQLYNDDVAIKMVLVDGTESLNFDTDREGDRTRTARAARTPATPWTRTPPTTSRASSPTATSAPCSATRPSSVS